MATTTSKTVRFNDRNDLKMLREKLQQTLDKFSQEHGLAVTATVGNCTFGDVSASFKIEMASQGDLYPRERKCWNDYSFSVTAHGIKPEALDQVFNYKGTDYKIVGLSVTRRKQPICCVRVRDEAMCFFPAVTVRASLPEAMRGTLAHMGSAAREIL